jgi:hypothetical protein
MGLDCVASESAFRKLYAAWHMGGGGPPFTTKWVTVTRSDSFEPSTQLGDDGLDRLMTKEESSNRLTTTANEPPSPFIRRLCEDRRLTL